MSIIVAVGVALIGLLMSSKSEKSTPKVIFGFLTFILVVVSFIALRRNDVLFEQLPFTRIDSAEVLEVKTGASFYLESSQSAVLSNKFYMSSNCYDDMTGWLKSTKKNVIVYIVDGANTVYSKNLGRYEEGLEDTVWEIYTTWTNDGVVPSNGTCYWFMFFYLEV